MATTTTAANAIEQVVQSDVVRGIFTNDAFWGIFRQETSPGDTNYRWNLLTNGITGQTRVEGDPYSAVDANAYSRPILAYRLYDSSFRVTDHLLAALKGGQAQYFGAVALELTEALNGVRDAVMTQWLGSSGEGWELAVDSTGTYANLAHNTTTGWDSQEDAINAALSYAALDDLREELRNVERRGRPNALFCAENQISNYTRLSGPGVRTTFTLNADAKGNNFDPGAARDGVSFGGIPIYSVPDMTTTVWIMTQIENWMILNHERVAGDGGWRSVEIPRGGHQQDFNISYFGVLCHTDPFRSGKLTGVTA